MAASLLSSEYVNGIYIPAGLLVFGTFIVKSEWVPYAALLAVALGALKFYNLRKFGPHPRFFPRPTSSAEF